MTIKQLLKLVQSSHPWNITLLTKWYITDNNFVIRDMNLASQLLEEYINTEYKKLVKVDTENELEPFDIYYSKRIESIKNINYKEKLETIEYLFNLYDYNIYENVEIIDTTLIDDRICVKFSEYENYLIDTKYTNIVNQFFGESNDIVSKAFNSDSFNVTPIAIKDASNENIIALIMPVKK